jgi:DNA replication and repair protein RecF
MYFKEIKLRDFRNYGEEKTTFHPKVNIITGDNAQGKTNLLEALYMMSLAKSFRTAKDNEMIGFGKINAQISTTSSKYDRLLELEILIEEGQKSIRIDGVKTTKNVDILENVYIVIFSPEDLKIVKEEPEKRRKFINMELCQIKPMYYKNLGKYKKILTQRNHLLKQEPVDMDVLSVWDEELAATGAKLIRERSVFIEKLDRISREIHAKITDGKEKLEILYESDVEKKEDLKEQIQEFIKKLEKTRKNDLYRRTTMTGPHRDDLRISIDGIDIRHFGSQGQQRTAALSLKLAEIQLIKEETGETPILLLDDVLSELDFSRQKFLISALSDVQLFITTTEISDYVRETLTDNYIFVVENGKIKREV